MTSILHLSAQEIRDTWTLVASTNNIRDYDDRWIHFYGGSSLNLTRISKLCHEAYLKRGIKE